MRPRLEVVRLYFQEKLIHGLVLLVVAPGSPWHKDVNDGSVFLRRFPAWMSNLSAGAMGSWRPRRAPIPTSHDGERASVQTGLQAAARPRADPAQDFVLRYNDGSSARSSFALVIATIFFDAAQIVRGCMLTSISVESAWRARALAPGSPATICCSTNANASPWSLCRPRGPRFQY